MTNYVNQYKKALKKNLRCSSNVKERLIDKFNRSLSTFLDDKPTPGMNEICDAFGSPKDMALVLMEEVTPEEIALYQRRKIITRIILGAVTVIFLAFVINVAIDVYKFNSTPFSSEDEIIIEDEEQSTGSTGSTGNTSVENEIIVEDEIIIED